MFRFSRKYHYCIRKASRKAIDFAVKHYHELLERALMDTTTIRYSKLVDDLGPWCPFYLMREKSAEVSLCDSPCRFRSGNYTAYHLNADGNLLLIRKQFKSFPCDDILCFEFEGALYYVTFSKEKHYDYFTSYRITYQDKRPIDTAMMNDLFLWAEHVDWSRTYDGNGEFVCSGYVFFSSAKVILPGKKMGTYRFLLENDHVYDVIEEDKPDSF